MKVNLRKELRWATALGTAALMSINGCFTLPSTSLVAYAANCTVDLGAADLGQPPGTIELPPVTTISDGSDSGGWTSGNTGLSGSTDLEPGSGGCLSGGTTGGDWTIDSGGGNTTWQPADSGGDITSNTSTLPSLTDIEDYDAKGVELFWEFSYDLGQGDDAATSVESVLLNGNKLKDTEYFVSIFDMKYIKLQPDTMGTLCDGIHQIAVTFDTGYTAYANFEVTNSDAVWPELTSGGFSSYTKGSNQDKMFYYNKNGNKYGNWIQTAYIDGVDVGKQSWEGHAMVYSNAFETLEPGYHTLRLKFYVGHIDITFEFIDPKAPKLDKSVYTIDFSTTNVVEIGYSLGSGTSAGLDIIGIQIDNKDIDKHPYTVSNNKIILCPNPNLLLYDKDYDISVLFRTSSGYIQVDATLQVINSVVNSMQPELESSNVEYTQGSSDGVSVKYSSGTGIYAPSCVTIIKVNNEDLDETHYDISGTAKTITLSKEYLDGLTPGEYKFDLYFFRGEDGNYDQFGYATKTLLVTVKENKPTIEVINGRFDAHNPWDLVFRYTLNSEDNAVSSIIVHSIHGTATVLAEHKDYSLLEHESTGVKEIQLLTRCLKQLSDGEYTMEVCFTDGSVCDYTIFTVENYNEGTVPTVEQRTVDFYADDTESEMLEYALGSGAKGASSISKVTDGNNELIKDSDWSEHTFDGGKMYVGLRSNYLKTLDNGEHTFNVVFDDYNNTSIPVTVNVINSTPSLDAEVYEYDAKNPVSLEIGYSLGYGTNKGTGVRSVTLDGNVLEVSEYHLSNNKITIFPPSPYQFTSDGDYDISVEFDIVSGGVKSASATLRVINTPSSSIYPSVTATEIEYTQGSNEEIKLTFTSGQGDSYADGILALILDDSIILPNGKLIAYNDNNVANIREIIEDELDEDYIIDEEEPNAFEEEDVPYVASSSDATLASPSNANGASTRKQVKKNTALVKLKTLFQADNDSEPVFTVEGTTVIISGEFISSLNLADGTYKLGVIFDNDELTVDDSVKLVIGSDKPTKPDSGDGDGEDNPPYKPEDPDEGDKDPEPESEKPKPSRPNVNSSSSRGGSHYSKPVNPQFNADGSQNANYKPSVPNTGGTWVSTADVNIWYYTKADGTNAANEWVGDGTNWYYIGSDGFPVSGWQLINNKWYYLNTEHNGTFGAMVTSWYFDKADGHWYYLSAIDGSLMTGWQYINSHWYYFHTNSSEPTYVDNNAEGGKFNGTGTKPHGSMYADEVTPDGYKVSENGAWTK